MARIPGPQDFAQVGPPEPVLDRTTGAEEEAVADFSNSVMQIGEQLKQRRQQAIDSGANAFLTAERQARYTEVFNNTPVDGDRPMAERLREQYREVDEELFERARKEKGYDFSQTERQRQEQKAANLRASFMSKGVTVEHNANIEKVENQASESASQFSLAAFNDPDSLPDVLEGIEETLSGYEGVPGISQEDLQQNIKSAKNKATVNAVEGLINTNPTEALERLNNNQYDPNLEAEQKNQLIDRARSAANRQGKVNRTRITNLVKDEIASRRRTGEPAGVISEDEIRAALPDRADEIIRQFRLEEQYYQDRQTISLQTPEEDAELLQQRTPKGLGFAEEAQKQDALMQALQQKYQMLGIGTEKPGDPVGYLAEVRPELVQGLSSDDPEVVRDTASSIMDLQADMGVPRSRRRVLSDSQAQQMVTQIESSSGPERADILSNFQETYQSEDEDFYQQAYSHLVDAGLSPESVVLAANAGNPLLTQQLSALIDIDEKQLRSDLGVVANDIEQAVIDESAEFFSAVEAGDFTGGASDITQSWRSVATKLAMQRFRQTGDVGKSVDSALTQLIDNNYHVVKSGNPGEGKGFNAYIPRIVQGVQTRPGQIEGVAIDRQTRDAIEAFDPAPIEDPASLEEVNKERVIRTAANSGFWVTNETGDGLMLMLPLGDGTALPLIDENGNRYEVGFFDAMQEEPAVTAAERERQTRLSPAEGL